MLKRTELKRRTPLRARSLQPRRSKPLKSRRRNPTKPEREHMRAVVALGCYACAKEGHYTPAIRHHIRVRPDGSHYGTGQRAGHYEVIPLCPDHHRNDGEAGKAYHAAPHLWVVSYGTELEALAWVRDQLKARGIASWTCVPIAVPMVCLECGHAQKVWDEGCECCASLSWRAIS
ncbi:MAG TPA: Ref family recombination enhancement nuclease [Holophaga sp.]|nr:Ref family recombination enhancement nuclease [Holophaga sp.]